MGIAAGIAAIGSSIVGGLGAAAGAAAGALGIGGAAAGGAAAATAGATALSGITVLAPAAAAATAGGIGAGTAAALGAGALGLGALAAGSAGGAGADAASGFLDPNANGAISPDGSIAPDATYGANPAAGGGILGGLGGVNGLASLAGVGANLFGSVNNANATNGAAQAQIDAYRQAAANLAPWMSGGQSAFGQQLGMLGLGPGGAAGQQSAIDQLKQSPFYQSLYHNGEQAVLANGAATGGLRGGNTQRSLYNLGTDTLAQAYQQQFNNLGSLSSVGQNAAAGVGNNQIGAGAAQAGGILGSANANNTLASSIAGLAGNQSLLNLFGGMGGGISNGSSLSNLVGLF